ncbi:Coniferyl aldehyde dehydrogenase [Mycolicibacterium smegmatis]|nr:Coniferyl aldehyde dehydrogenase [Mycolicibacterium smegmatis]
MGAYHGKAGFDAFSHHRTVVGTDLPFSITGRAALPFTGSMRVSADLALWRARSRTKNRLRKFR